MNVNNKFVIVSNKLLRTSNNMKCLILALIQLNMSLRGECVFNVRWLLNQLKIQNNSYNSVNHVKKLILELQNEGYLKFNSKLTRIDNSELLFASLSIEDNFVQITDSELAAICSYDEKDIVVSDLFSLFANIKSRIDDKGYCYPSFEVLKQDTGIKSDTTIVKYNSILRDELGLILIENIGNRVFTDGTIKKANNLYVINDEYGRNTLGNAILVYRSNLEENQIKVNKNKNGNLKRSIKMKQRHLQDRFDKGLICINEFERRYGELDIEYGKLISKGDNLS